MRLSHGTQQSGRAIAVTERARIRPKITSNGRLQKWVRQQEDSPIDEWDEEMIAMILQARRLFLYKNNLQMRSGLESRRLGESLPAPAARLASTSFLRSFCNFSYHQRCCHDRPHYENKDRNPQWSRRGRCDEWNEAE